MDELTVRYSAKRAQAAARVAVTGRSAGPPLFEMLEILGRDESLRRLKAGLARLA
jgi:glutamyl-tRNA synthetase